MERQYVHLSLERKTAVRIGARHDERPIVLTVNASDAHAAGVEFYQADEAVYLAKYITSQAFDSKWLTSGLFQCRKGDRQYENIGLVNH